MYVKYICKMSGAMKFVFDYINVFLVGDNIEQVFKNVTGEMKKLKLWLDCNKLSLNVRRTKIMFGNCKTDNELKL